MLVKDTINKKDIPENIRTRALAEIDKIVEIPSCEFENKSNMSWAFMWRNTPSGYNFWSEINSAPDKDEAPDKGEKMLVKDTINKKDIPEDMRTKALFWNNISDAPDKSKAPNKGEVREFDTGATRDSNEGKLDFEGFLSPIVLLRYAEYMHEHRKQTDGKLRASDNWQKGIPKDVYMKSLCRHLMDVWLNYREFGEAMSGPIENSLCAVIFNAMGFLHETLKGRE